MYRAQSIRWPAAIAAATLLLASPLLPQVRRVRGVRGTPKTVNTGMALPAAGFDGTLVKLDGKEILLEAEEGRLIEIRRNGKTRFFKGPAAIKPADFRPGDHVSVEASLDLDNSLLAVNVYLGDAPGAKKAKSESSSEAYSLEVPADEEERLKQQKADIRSGEAGGILPSAGSKGGEQKYQAPADEDKQLDEQKQAITPGERKLLRRAPPLKPADATQNQDQNKQDQKKEDQQKP